MKVYELIKALEDVDPHLQVNALQWPETNGQPLKLTSVTGCALHNDTLSGEMLVLRIATSL